MAKKKAEKKPARKKTERRIRMMVIPEPEPNTRSVLVYTGAGTVLMRGPGNVVMECGNCGAPLIVGMPVATLQSVVLRCASCGAYNDSLA